MSSDLHMEHLNCECKNSISGMGTNVTKKSVQRVGRAIKVLTDTLHKLDDSLVLQFVLWSTLIIDVWYCLQVSRRTLGFPL